MSNGRTRLGRAAGALLAGAALCGGLWLAAQALAAPAAAQTAATAPPLAAVVIGLTPDEMTLTGHAATRANTVGQCPEPWLTTAPTGTVLLGVNPASCNPSAWAGGQAMAQVFLPRPYPTTVYVLELAWPDEAGRGLHSPGRGPAAVIAFDGQPVWSKRTTDLGPFGDYYAAQHGPIVTTLVVTQALTHTLAISVPAQTAWDLSRIELRAYPEPAAIQGIGYSPYHDCQAPGSPLPEPTTADLLADLIRLRHTSTAIRTYAATGVNAQIPALANALGLPVYAGAWLDAVPEDAAELQGLITLANTTDVEGVIVGNEYYLRHRTAQALADLRQHLLTVQAAVPVTVPVTTAEIDSLMFDWGGDPYVYSPTLRADYRPILDAVDLVMVHIYPFWNGMPVEGAAEFVVRRYQAIQALLEREYPGQSKRVVIGETGWPAGVSALGQAVPNRANQERYLREFLALAEAAQVDYFYFDAFDELWKIEEAGHVGQNWGYSYTDRSAKHDFYGVLLPAGQLPPDVPPPTAPAQLYLPLLSTAGRRTFPVYDEWPEGPGRFIPSGWLGDYQNLTFYGCDRTGPHNGEMAIRNAFAAGGPNQWGGLYWQYPENNWGTLPSGLDLRGAARVTFWARSAAPDAHVTFMVGGVGYPSNATTSDCSQPLGPYPDSVCPKIQMEVTLSTTWTQYSLDLRQAPARDFSRVIGGFGWVAREPVLFYLDDIVYEYD